METRKLAQWQASLDHVLLALIFLPVKVISLVRKKKGGGGGETKTSNSPVYFQLWLFSKHTDRNSSTPPATQLLPKKSVSTDGAENALLWETWQWFKDWSSANWSSYMKLSSIPLKCICIILNFVGWGYESCFVFPILHTYISVYVNIYMVVAHLLFWKVIFLSWLIFLFMLFEYFIFKQQQALLFLWFLEDLFISNFLSTYCVIF